MIESSSAPSVTTSSPNLLSSKIRNCHLERTAIVYVRQSSTKQVEENIESTQMQYQLVDRAAAFGWPQNRIDVIDDDLGVSGRSIEGRVGFQRLLAEVSLEHIGIVLGIEMSRLARSCRDWHQLLELCSVHGTLLADADGVYDPRDHNDRLLLGLKGTMSEAELHVLQGRLRAGQMNKARRGEYFNHAPTGYVRTENSLAKEPDDQARAVVELIFAKFTELGSMSAVLRYLRDEQIQIGVRDHRGPDKGQLRFRPVNQASLLCLLHHPVYAGAYVYGRREVNAKKTVPGQPGKGRRWASRENWDVLIHNKLPAYITWSQWESNQEKLWNNSAKYRMGGAARGTSLLAGRVICGRCGHRMSISYSGKSNARFTCDMSRNHWGTDQCQTLKAKPLRDLIERQLLIALEPVSIELSLKAFEAMAADRHKVEHHHQQTIDRAIYQSELARRRYEEVDPSNRLVTSELERRWEAALNEQREAEESLARFRQKTSSKLSRQQESLIRSLSSNIPQLWSAPTTSGVDRQTILRTLVEEIVVEVLGTTERVRVTVRWQGGFESHHEIIRPVGKVDKLEAFAEIRSRILQLKRRGHAHQGVAAALNSDGYRSTAGGEFTTPIVSQLCRRFRSEGEDVSAISGYEDYWAVGSLSQYFGVHVSTVTKWTQRGWIHAEKSGQHWVLWADNSELIRLRKLVDYRGVDGNRIPDNVKKPSQPQ